MTLIEAITRVDDLKPNDFDINTKRHWLSNLDCQIKTEVLDEFEGAENIAFTGYDENTSDNTVLLVPAPYDEMYIHYLAMKIDYYNGELDKQNTNAELFNIVLDEFKGYYIRHNMPKNTPEFTYI